MYKYDLTILKSFIRCEKSIMINLDQITMTQLVCDEV